MVVLVVGETKLKHKLKFLSNPRFGRTRSIYSAQGQKGKVTRQFGTAMIRQFPAVKPAVPAGAPEWLGRSGASAGLGSGRPELATVSRSGYFGLVPAWGPVLPVLAPVCSSFPFLRSSPPLMAWLPCGSSSAMYLMTHKAF